MFEQIRLDKFSGSIPDRRAIARQCSRLWYSAQNQSQFNDAGVNIQNADWDVLIILDACRGDSFKSRCTLPGETSIVESKGSATPEWLRANIAGRDLTDTVCVSANGQYFRHADDAIWHAFKEVLDSELANAHGADLVAPPDQVTDRARTALEQYPHKRLLIHYAQPHLPYLGELGQQYFEPGQTPVEIGTNPAVSRELLADAYHENLDLAFNAVEDLFSSTPEMGRVIVTADHGELLGERVGPLPVRQWGHPEGIYHPALVRVPWHVYEDGSRRDIVAESPAENEITPDDEKLTEHLEALGYVE